MGTTSNDSLFNVYRSEWKFYINKAEYYYLRDILKNIMTLDPNMGERGEYYIRSLYFDSADNIDYTTKVMGLERRKKIRLRIYGCDDRKVKLEVKNRYNSYMLKESLVITKEDAQEIIKGNFDVLMKYDKPVAMKVKNIMETGYYTPKVIVDYEREAFIYPEHNVRVTFDKNVRAITSDELFSDELGAVPLVREPVTILEVKYDQMLPEYIRDAISSAGLLKSSISKYCMAREMLG